MSLKDLQKYIKNEPEILLFGERQCAKKAKLGQLKEVFLSSDCAKRIKEKVENYAKLSDIAVHSLHQSRGDLSLICKKTFPISIIGVVNN